MSANGSRSQPKDVAACMASLENLIKAIISYATKKISEHTLIWLLLLSSLLRITNVNKAQKSK